MSDPAPAALPSAVASLLAALDASGFRARLVGAAAEAVWRGVPIRDFEVAVAADPEALLDHLPTAVPLDASLDGRPTRLLLPCEAGPVELVVGCHDLDETLAARDFTLHAMAIDAAGTVTDPFDGRGDVAARRLRCVGKPVDAFARDPLRRLRAVRLVATRGLEPDAELARALCAGGRAFAGVAAVRLRGELHALLLADEVEGGLELLRRSGLEAALAEDVADDAARVVGALPSDLTLRLAGWLRGARAVRTLRRLREPRERVLAIERLLQLHPIEHIASADQEARIARFTRRSASLVPGLLALRRAEIEARDEDRDARDAFARLCAAIERAQAPGAPREAEALAIGGHEVMEILGCSAGPEVGRALHQLEKAVRADPTCNTRETLRERLLAWQASQSPSKSE
jgi:tRNA nucleotidyltransferase/poly(A) polymerase